MVGPDIELLEEETALEDALVSKYQGQTGGVNWKMV